MLFRAIKFSIFLLITNNVFADNIQLTVVDIDADRNLPYMRDVLEKSLQAAGHNIEFKVTRNISQARAFKELEKDRVDIHWFLQTEERNKKLIPVKVPLTNNLIGKRVFLIPKGTQEKFDNIKNLEDFRKRELVGIFGEGWYDVKVWAAAAF